MELRNVNGESERQIDANGLILETIFPYRSLSKLISEGACFLRNLRPISPACMAIWALWRHVTELARIIGETPASGIVDLTSNIWSDVDWVSPVPMARHRWCRLCWLGLWSCSSFWLSFVGIAIRTGEISFVNYKNATLTERRHTFISSSLLAVTLVLVARSFGLLFFYFQLSQTW